MSFDLSIVHLSDLHFGEDSRFKGTDIQPFGIRCAQDVQREYGEPDLVIVTGDITQTAGENEFKQAGEFFRIFQTTLNMQRSRFVFLPGNHDLSWKACKDYYRTHPGKINSEFDLDLFKKKFQLFEDFKSRFYEKDTPPIQDILERGACLYVYEDLGICIAAFNSSEDETDTCHVGKISLEQSRPVMDALKNKAFRNYIRIIALHYPLNADSTKTKEWINWIKEEHSDDNKIDKSLLDRLEHDALSVQGNEQVMRIAKNLHVHLILHGHQHASDSLAPFQWGDSNTYGQICPAGSFGIIPKKLPKNQLNCMRLLHFKSKNDKLEFTGTLLEYDPTEYSSNADLKKGCFRNTNRDPVTASFPLPVRLRHLKLSSNSEDKGSNEVDDRLLEYVRKKIEFILDTSPSLCTLLSKVFDEIDDKNKVANTLLRKRIKEVWSTMAGNLDLFKETPDELLKLLFLLVLIEIKKEHIEELREQLHSDEETSMISLHFKETLMAEFLLKAALESDLQLNLSADAPITPRNMIASSLYRNQKNEAGLDHNKAQKEVLHNLIEQLKISSNDLPKHKIHEKLKSTLRAYYDSKEPFYIVHQYNNSFAIPYLVEFMGLSPADYSELSKSADFNVTRSDDTYLNALLRIISKNIMKLKPQDSL